MKVWIVHQHAVPPSLPGSVRPFALAKELVSRGHEVVIPASSFNHWTRTEMRLQAGEDSRSEVVDGVQFLWLRAPAYPGSGAMRFVSMLSYATNLFSSRALRALGPPDVIVGSSPNLIAAYGAERLANDLGAAFVFEVRDIWPQSLVDVGRMSPRHPVVKLMGWMENHLVRNAGSIVSLLPTNADYYVEKGAQVQGYFWVPNGVYLPDLPHPKPIPHNERFTVLFAGIHGIANGLDTVLEAAQVLSEAGVGDKVLFRFLGDGGEKPRLVQRALDMGLTNVEFLDAVPKGQVPEMLAQADAGLLILKKSPVFRWGVSPNKLFDYLGAGRPVIYAVESSNNPVEEAGAGVTVRAEDPDDLAAGVVRLMDTPRDERQRMGDRARAYVEEHHDFARLGDRFEQALQHAVALSRLVN